MTLLSTRKWAPKHFGKIPACILLTEVNRLEKRKFKFFIFSVSAGPETANLWKTGSTACLTRDYLRFIYKPPEGQNGLKLKTQMESRPEIPDKPVNCEMSTNSIFPVE